MMPLKTDLRERGLLRPALDICKVLHVRLRDLRREGDDPPMATPLIAEARTRFALHLLDRGWSYPAIAQLLGYKAHSAIMCLVGAPGVSAKHQAGAVARAAKFAHLRE